MALRSEVVARPRCRWEDNFKL